jgi:hypothetical protein
MTTNQISERIAQIAEISRQERKIGMKRKRQTPRATPSPMNEKSEK